MGSATPSAKGVTHPRPLLPVSPFSSPLLSSNNLLFSPAFIPLRATIFCSTRCLEHAAGLVTTVDGYWNSGVTTCLFGRWVMDVPVEGVSVLTCFNCSLNLTGHRYILRDDKPFCIACYENLFANRCEECKQAIGTDFKVSDRRMWYLSIRCVLKRPTFSQLGLKLYFVMM